MDTLLDILQELHQEVDFSVEEHLIDDGILDSFDIVSLVSEIQEEFDVTIGARDIIPSNFNSAQAMYAMIERLEEDDED